MLTTANVLRYAVATLLFTALNSTAVPQGTTDVSISKSKEPIRTSPDTNLDVLGIKLGSSIELARQALRKEYGAEPIEKYFQRTVHYKNMDITSEKFIGTLTDSKNNNTDRIEVLVATPTTGRTVVRVTRVVTFLDAATAPDYEDFRHAAMDKYGPNITKYKVKD